MIAFIVASDQVELVSGELWAAGVAGIEERCGPDGQVELIVACGPEAVEEIADRRPNRRIEADPDEWVHTWRPWARAVEVAPGVVVRPPWVAPSGAPLEVVIDPDRAWGHGAHPTTVLCVGWLARRLPIPRRVLDVGCGSGTLSVAAALLGADVVVAIDVDPEAHLATTANTEANGVADRVRVSDDLVEDVEGVYDVVLANIGAQTVCDLAPHLVAKLGEGARVVLSGLLSADVESVAAAFRPLGLLVDDVEERDGWALLVLARPVDLR